MFNIGLEECELLSDSRYKSYVGQVERALKAFEYTSEWADLISALAKLNKVLSTHIKYPVIPKRVIIGKRLAQCLHPALPSGVHLKVLETYDIIFKCIGTSRLASDLFTYSAGLFPLLGYAAMNVRGPLLQLYETHFVSLARHIKPALTGLISALLPGLEEGSEHFDRTGGLLEDFCEAVEPTFFYGSLWECVVASSANRLAAINFVLAHFNKRQSMEDQLHFIGTNIERLVAALCVSVEDSNILVQRSTLDLLLLGFRLHNSQLTRVDMIRITASAIRVVLRRDMSLNRRLYAWLLGTDSNGLPLPGLPGSGATSTVTSNTGLGELERQDSTVTIQGMDYFNVYAKDLLVAAIKQSLRGEETQGRDRVSSASRPGEKGSRSAVNLRPFRVLMSLLDKPEVGSAVLEDILLEIFRCMYRECTAATCTSLVAKSNSRFLGHSLFTNQSYDGKAGQKAADERGGINSEIVKTANLLFGAFEPFFIWQFIGRTFEAACSSAGDGLMKGCKSGLAPDLEKRLVRSSSVASDKEDEVSVEELCSLVEFLLDKLTVEAYRETQTVHLPVLLLSMMTSITNHMHRLTDLQVSASLHLCSKILSRVQPAVTPTSSPVHRPVSATNSSALPGGRPTSPSTLRSSKPSSPVPTGSRPSSPAATAVVGATFVATASIATSSLVSPTHSTLENGESAGFEPEALAVVDVDLAKELADEKLVNGGLVNGDIIDTNSPAEGAASSDSPVVGVANSDSPAGGAANDGVEPVVGGDSDVFCEFVQFSKEEVKLGLAELSESSTAENGNMTAEDSVKQTEADRRAVMQTTSSSINHRGGSNVAGLLRDCIVCYLHLYQRFTELRVVTDRDILSSFLSSPDFIRFSSDSVVALPSVEKKNISDDGLPSAVKKRVPESTSEKQNVSEGRSLVEAPPAADGAVELEGTVERGLSYETCSAFELACHLLVEFSSLPIQTSDSQGFLEIPAMEQSTDGNESSLFDRAALPRWLQLLVACACGRGLTSVTASTTSEGHDLSTDVKVTSNQVNTTFTLECAAISAVLDLISLTQSVIQQGSRSNESDFDQTEAWDGRGRRSLSDGLTVSVNILPILSERQLEFLNTATNFHRLTAELLWEYLGESNAGCHSTSVDLLYQLQQLSPDPWTCEDVISSDLLSLDKTQKYAAHCKFTVLWHLMRDRVTQSVSVPSLNVRTFDRSLLVMLDSLNTEDTHICTALSQTWLMHCVQRSDLIRVLEPILLILLHPDTARVSIQHVSIHSPRRVRVRNDSTDSVANSDTSSTRLDTWSTSGSSVVEANIYAISSEGGHVIYHVATDRGGGGVSVPPQRKVSSKKVAEELQTLLVKDMQGALSRAPRNTNTESEMCFDRVNPRDLNLHVNPFGAEAYSADTADKATPSASIGQEFGDLSINQNQDSFCTTKNGTQTSRNLNPDVQKILNARRLTRETCRKEKIFFDDEIDGLFETEEETAVKADGEKIGALNSENLEKKKDSRSEKDGEIKDGSCKEDESTEVAVHNIIEDIIDAVVGSDLQDSKYPAGRNSLSPGPSQKVDSPSETIEEILEVSSTKEKEKILENGFDDEVAEVDNDNISSIKEKKHAEESPKDVEVDVEGLTEQNSEKNGLKEIKSSLESERLKKGGSSLGIEGEIEERDEELDQQQSSSQTAGITVVEQDSAAEVARKGYKGAAADETYARAAITSTPSTTDEPISDNHQAGIDETDGRMTGLNNTEGVLPPDQETITDADTPPISANNPVSSSERVLPPDHENFADSDTHPPFTSNSIPLPTVHPLHTHMLLYTQKYDTARTLYALRCIKSVLGTSARNITCALTTANLGGTTTPHIQRLLELLVRHRRSVFGKSFHSDPAGSTGTGGEALAGMRSSMFIEVLVSVCLYYMRSYYPNLMMSKLSKEELSANKDIQILSCDILNMLLSELIGIVRSSGRGFATYIGELLIKCKVQKAILYLVLSSVYNGRQRSRPASGGRDQMNLTEAIIAFNDWPDFTSSSLGGSGPAENDSCETLQIRLLKLLLTVIVLEDQVRRSTGDQTAVTAPLPSEWDNINVNCLLVNTSGTGGSIQDYLSGRPAVYQPMLLTAVLATLKQQHMCRMHRHWVALVISATPYLHRALTRVTVSTVGQLCRNVELLSQLYEKGSVQQSVISKPERIPTDHIITMLEGLTTICHHCLLDTGTTAGVSGSTSGNTVQQSTDLAHSAHSLPDCVPGIRLDMGGADILDPGTGSGGLLTNIAQSLGGGSRELSPQKDAGGLGFNCRQEARGQLLNILPRVLSSLTVLWRALRSSEGQQQQHDVQQAWWSMGTPRAVRQCILEFISPLALQHTQHVLAAVAVVWNERRYRAGATTRRVIPLAGTDQLLLVDLVYAVKLLPIDTIIQTVKQIIKQPPQSGVSSTTAESKLAASQPAAAQRGVGVPLEVGLLRFLYSYIQRVESHSLTDTWPILLSLLRDALQINLIPPGQFTLLAILSEFLQKVPMFDDRKDQKDLQEIAQRLLEAISEAAGASLEQTTFFRRNLAVKPGPQTDVSVASELEEVEENESNNTDIIDVDNLDKPVGTFPNSAATARLSGSLSSVTAAGVAAAAADARQYSVQALVLLADVTATLLDIVYRSEEKEQRVAPLLVNILYNVFPYLRNHSVNNQPSFRASSQLLASLSSYQYSRRAWKKEAFELLIDSAFFEMEEDCVRPWMITVDNLMSHDRTTFKDLLTRVNVAQGTSLNLFSSREAEFEQRAQLLKRLSFVILCSEIDQYQKFMPDIQEKLADCLRLPMMLSLQAQVFLCFRVLLLRMSAQYLTSLWPTIITELVHVMLQIEQELMPEDKGQEKRTQLSKLDASSWRQALAANSSGRAAGSSKPTAAAAPPAWLQLYLHACKLLDLALSLPADVIPQFQLYRWAFVGEGGSASPIDVSDKRRLGREQPPSFVPHVIKIARLMHAKFGEIPLLPYPPSCVAASKDSNYSGGETQTGGGLHGPLLTSPRVGTLQDLCGFFATIYSIIQQNGGIDDPSYRPIGPQAGLQNGLSDEKNLIKGQHSATDNLTKAPGMSRSLSAPDVSDLRPLLGNDASPMDTDRKSVTSSTPLSDLPLVEQIVIRDMLELVPSK